MTWEKHSDMDNKSIARLREDLRSAYKAFVASLDHNDPSTYDEWLEDEVIDLSLKSLSEVMTTAEVEKVFGLAVGTAKKAAQRGDVVAEKRGHDWLIPRIAAMQRWGKRE